MTTSASTGAEMVGREIDIKLESSTSVATREHQAHSRTPVLLRFSVSLPSVEAEREVAGAGRMGPCTLIA